MRFNVQMAAAMLMIASAITQTVRAHQPDTSYARIKIARDSLECEFTYDLFTLVRIVPELDANSDRQITDVELAAGSASVHEFIRNNVQLEIGGVTAEFGDPGPVEFPSDVGTAIPEQDYHAATSLVHFNFRRSLDQPPADIWILFNFFRTFGAVHTVISVIEQDDQAFEVLFRYYEPDYFFDTGYEVEPVDEESSEMTIVNGLPSTVTPNKPGTRNNLDGTVWQQLVSFFWLGVEHIFIGIDHILFLLSLLVVCKFGELLKIVTSFTIAHTITLILATLEVITVPGRLVETAIAATIVYVAVENFWIKDTSRRWILTFVFGLIHGFGFAGVLRELGLPAVGLVRSLVSFNVGVEVGQVVIVLLLYPLIVALTKWKHGRIVQNTISATIALCGLGWFVDRAFALGWMPF